MRITLEFDILKLSSCSPKLFAFSSFELEKKTVKWGSQSKVLNSLNNNFGKLPLFRLHFTQSCYPLVHVLKHLTTDVIILLCASLLKKIKLKYHIFFINEIFTDFMQANNNPMHIMLITPMVYSYTGHKSNANFVSICIVATTQNSIVL